MRVLEIRRCSVVGLKVLQYGGRVEVPCLRVLKSLLDRTSETGELVRNIFFLNAAWTVIDIAVVDDTNGPNIRGPQILPY